MSLWESIKQAVGEGNTGCLVPVSLYKQTDGSPFSHTLGTYGEPRGKQGLIFIKH